MGVRDTARCARCKKDFPFSQVKYLEGGKRLACLQCLGVATLDREEIRERHGKVFDFQCVECRYAFHRTYANTPKVCPQCGKKKLLKFEKKKLTGEKLLRQ